LCFAEGPVAGNSEYSAKCKPFNTSLMPEKPGGLSSGVV
jgi:hypothetical protein